MVAGLAECLVVNLMLGLEKGVQEGLSNREMTHGKEYYLIF